MTETTSTTPAPDAPPTSVATTVPPPPAPAALAEPEPASRGSRAWLGVLAGLIAVALLSGATAVLFVRVQEAQDRADEAVTLAGNQDALTTRIDSVDASLAQLESGSATSEDLQAARDQLASLRKCVNTALDSFAQATQSGKPVSITKC
ncbi:MAG: hypothetical protein WDA60_14475 [Acidimicrobiia bacterium]|jgi:uncharacterized protein HemX